MGRVRLAAGLLVAVALCLLACAPVSHAQIRPGCVKQYQCPQRNTNQCGLYYNCKNVAKPTPPYSLIVCDNCAFKDPTKAWARVCNFTNGRCVPNVVDGAKCNPAVANQCGPPAAGFKCSPDISSKAKVKPTRCCRTKCPPGMCGNGGGAKPPTATYVNACGQKIACPGVCPK